MKKISKWLSLLLALSMIFCVASVSASADDTYNLVMSIEDTADTPNSVACAAWAEELKEASGGRLNIQIYYGAVLAGPTDVLSMVQSGGVDMAWVATAPNAASFPILNVTNTPNIGHFSSQQCTAAVLRLYEESPEVQEEFTALGVHPLAMHGCGVAMLATTNKELTDLDAFKGVQIRCNNGSFAAVVQDMGMATMACSQGELYENLEKNVIEGNLTDVANLISTRSYEICKEIMNYSFGNNIGFVCMNQAKFDSLPEDLQALLDDRFESLSFSLAEGYNDYTRNFLSDVCAENGVTIYDPSQEVLDKLNEDATSLIHAGWVESMNEMGYDGQALLDLIKTCYADAHEEYGEAYDWVQ